jgi:hypothetical protein
VWHRAVHQIGRWVDDKKFFTWLIFVSRAIFLLFRGQSVLQWFSQQTVFLDAFFFGWLCCLCPFPLPSYSCVSWRFATVAILLCLLKKFTMFAYSNSWAGWTSDTKSFMVGSSVLDSIDLRNIQVCGNRCRNFVLTFLYSPDEFVQHETKEQSKFIVY